MHLRAINIERCIGCYSCMFACARFRFNSVSITKSAVHVKTQGGLEGNFVVITCRNCADPPCVKACKVGALSKRSKGGVALDENSCTGCGDCVKACIVGALVMDYEGKKPINCIHCGVCAQFCPHGILILEKVEGE